MTLAPFVVYILAAVVAARFGRLAIRLLTCDPYMRELPPAATFNARENRIELEPRYAIEWRRRT